MKPYYQDEWVTIYHGDCREILPQIDKVDLVLTDPPYKDADIGCEYYEWFLQIWGLLLGAGRDYIVFFNNATRLYDIFQLLGKPYRVMTWHKTVSNYAWRWEPIFIYEIKPDFKFNNHIWSDSLSFIPVHHSVHKYEKPMDLMKRLVTYVPNGKSIVDPFAGSGTTLMASKTLGHKCIGIEIEEKYCEIAAKRCSQGVFELGL